MLEGSDQECPSLSSQNIAVQGDNLEAITSSCSSDATGLSPATFRFELDSGDAVLPGGLKYGGDNFYSTEFAEKLCRSLPFIKTGAKSRVLKDWLTDTEIFPKLGVSVNMDRPVLSVNSGLAKSKDVQRRPVIAKKEKILLHCDQCSEVFDLAYRLKRHLDKVHFRILDCPKCSKTFSSKFYAKGHIQSCQGLKMKPEKKIKNNSVSDKSVDSSSASRKKQLKSWQCLICPKRLCTAKYVARHFKIFHPDQNPETSTSKIAPEGEISRQPKQEPKPKIPLEPKIREGTNRRQCFPCKYCSRVSTRAHDLKRHIQRIHFICTDCSTKFSNKSEIKQHLNECNKIHPFNKIDLSTIVSTDSVRSKGLSVPFKYEKDEVYQFQCFSCATFYPTQISLLKHATNVHIKKYSCKLCKETFLTQLKLNNHTESCPIRMSGTVGLTEINPEASSKEEKTRETNSTIAPLPSGLDGLDLTIPTIGQFIQITTSSIDEERCNAKQTEQHDTEAPGAQTHSEASCSLFGVEDFERETQIGPMAVDDGIRSEFQDSGISDGLNYDSASEYEHSLIDTSLDLDVTPEVVKKKSILLKREASADEAVDVKLN